MPPAIRPHFAQLKSYLASVPPVPPRIKLSANENPLGPSPKVLGAIAKATQSLNVYPDGAAHAFKRAAAEHHGVEPNQISVGVGSDELVRLLGTLFLDGPETEVLTAEPSFASYSEIAAFALAKSVTVAVDANRAIDLDEMAQAITPNTRLIFLANPNNPTGSMFRQPELEAFLDRVPETALVVLDEAYYEYACGFDGYPNGIELLKFGRPICVLRTFSKMHSLAALRFGYAVGTPELVDLLERVRPPFNVNAIAQAAAISALSDEEHIERSLAANETALNRIRKLLERMGATTFPSYGNFVYAEFPVDAAPIGAKLAEHGIAVRAGKQVWKPESIRISAGTPDQLDALEAALSTIEAEVPPA